MIHLNNIQEQRFTGASLQEIAISTSIQPVSGERYDYNDNLKPAQKKNFS